ncbi:hypothetical protein AOLI_G00117500 [Acnodon oligacanthus]
MCLLELLELRLVFRGRRAAFNEAAQERPRFRIKESYSQIDTQDREFIHAQHAALQKAPLQRADLLTAL